MGIKFTGTFKTFTGNLRFFVPETFVSAPDPVSADANKWTDVWNGQSVLLNIITGVSALLSADVVNANKWTDAWNGQNQLIDIITGVSAIIEADLANANKWSDVWNGQNQLIDIITGTSAFIDGADAEENKWFMDWNGDFAEENLINNTSFTILVSGSGEWISTIMISAETYQIVNSGDWSMDFETPISGFMTLNTTISAQTYQIVNSGVWAASAQTSAEWLDLEL